MDCMPSSSFPTRSMTLQVVDNIIRWSNEVDSTSSLMNWGVMHAWLLFHSPSDTEFKDF